VIVWFAAVIPLVVLAITFSKFKNRVVWWEVLVQVAVPISLILLSKWMIETSQTNDTEFWGGWGVRAEYYEDWNERVSCRHPIPCSHSTYDSKGNYTGTAHSNDGYSHLYDVDYHPPYWEIDDSNGDSHRISKPFFASLTKRWGNQKKVDLGRSFHDNDGDKYVTVWDQKKATLEAVTTQHTYENRVAVSDSVFNFKEIENPEELGLFEYPKISGYKQRVILGKGGADHVQAEKELNYFNATLGRKKQVRLFLLIYRNTDMATAMDQEAYWKGGNKNELVSCVGVDDENAVQWSYVFSWSKSEELKAEARNQLVGQEKLDLPAYVAWLGPAVDKSFVRLEFAEFDYLSVEPPWWAVLIVYALTALVSVGIAFWVVMNNQHHERRFRWGRARY
jgi:hypothetical protein